MAKRPFTERDAALAEAAASWLEQYVHAVGNQHLTALGLAITHELCDRAAAQQAASWGRWPRVADLLDQREHAGDRD
jgi:hypothetical protein